MQSKEERGHWISGCRRCAERHTSISNILGSISRLVHLMPKQAIIWETVQVLTSQNFCKNFYDCPFPYQNDDGFSQNGPQMQFITTDLMRKMALCSQHEGRDSSSLLQGKPWLGQIANGSKPFNVPTHCLHSN